MTSHLVPGSQVIIPNDIMKVYITALRSRLLFSYFQHQMLLRPGATVLAVRNSYFHNSYFLESPISGIPNILGIPTILGTTNLTSHCNIYFCLEVRTFGIRESGVLSYSGQNWQVAFKWLNSFIK